ncbi:MAG: hypothetical protein COB66_05585 [Coxiella sp. (in: Bacteria)]|nr:MAG: hypothetical protein COB66_05585 [Coxiella sp. (in: g-proteobacteria)]
MLMFDDKNAHTPVTPNDADDALCVVRVLPEVEQYVAEQRKELMSARIIPSKFTDKPYSDDVLMSIRQYYLNARKDRSMRASLLAQSPADRCFNVLKWLDADGNFNAFFLFYEEAVNERYSDSAVSPSFYVTPLNCHWLKNRNAEDKPRMITSALSAYAYICASFNEKCVLAKAAVCLLESRTRTSDVVVQNHCVDIADAVINDKFWSSEFPPELMLRIKVQLKRWHFESRVAPECDDLQNLLEALYSKEHSPGIFDASKQQRPASAPTFSGCSKGASMRSEC